MKVRTVSLIVLFIFSIITSCSCPTDSAKINGVELVEYDRSTRQSYQPQNTIDFSDLFITVNIGFSIDNTISFNWNRLSLIQPAFASEPCSYNFEKDPSELITKIEIFSNSDFNEVSPQGSDLFNNFQLFYGIETISFTLLSAPEENSSHVFHFKVYVEDGSFYEVFTNPINFEVE